MSAPSPMEFFGEKETPVDLSLGFRPSQTIASWPLSTSPGDTQLQGTNSPALLAPFSALCQLFLISDLSTEITMEMGPSVSNSARPHLVSFCPSHPGCLKKVSQDSMKYLLTPWVQDPGAFFRKKISGYAGGILWPGVSKVAT